MRADNAQDAEVRVYGGRQYPRKEPVSKLTPEVIERAATALLADPELSIRKLAPEYGVNESTLRRALRRSRPDGLSGEVAPELVEVPVIVRDYRHLEELYVYPMSDVHLGSPSHQAAKWQEWLDYVAETPRTSLLLNGDLFNSAIVGSKSDVYREEGVVEDHVYALEDQLRPIAEDGRIDGMNPGNHEDRIWRAVGIDPVRMVARNLGAPYFRASAMVVYLVGDQRYEVYVRHGTGNGQSLMQHEKNLRIAQADVYVNGHIHNQSVRRGVVMGLEGKRMVRRKWLSVSSGSFLAYEEYAAVRGYPPTAIGAPRIYLSGERKDFHASI